MITPHSNHEEPLLPPGEPEGGERAALPAPGQTAADKRHPEAHDEGKPPEKKERQEREGEHPQQPPPPPDRASLRRFIILGLIGLAILVVLFLVGLIPHLMRVHRIQQQAAQQQHQVREAHVARVHRAAAVSDVVLPGTLQAFEASPIYARSNGYLREWKVDIGDHVKKGQLLAVVESPELEQQVEQAQHQLGVSRAAREQTVANLNLAKITRDRWNNLVKEHAVSQQDADQRNADYEVQVANLKSADAQIRAQEANVAQLQQLLDYDRIIAPFDGVITARNVDVGWLITAGSNNSATALFQIAQIDRLRLFVSVPEPDVPSISIGMTAQVIVNEYPNRTFKGTVDRTANAIDIPSKTLLTELLVGNPEHALLPGMFSFVTLRIDRKEPPVEMPSAALLFRAEGPQVGVVRDNHVHFVKIVIGRDYGERMEILSGLKENDLVLTDPTNDFQENEEVKIVEDHDVPGAATHPGPSTPAGASTQAGGGAP